MSIDRTSQTWTEIAGWAQAGITDAHKRLEQTGLDLPATEHIRGEITTLRALLEMGDPKTQAPVIPETPDYRAR